MSPATRRLRFLGTASPSDDLVERLCDNSDPAKSLTLLVCRHTGTASQITGMGSYFRISGELAEVAFAVGDKVHGKGIATALLEQLARHGAAQDFESFTATVLAENHEMLDVFHHSGFTVHSTSDAGAIEVHLRITSPPIKWPCFYGIDMSTRQELVASDLTIDEINAFLGADSLGYLSLDGLVRAAGSPKDDFCRACFDGEYPVAIPERAGKFVLEEQLQLPTP